MQTAITKSSQTTFYAGSAPHTLSYKCQLCEQPVSLKQGRVRRPHFCHIGGHCGSPEGEWRRHSGKESAKHLQAKEDIARLLRHDKRVSDMEYECRIKLPESLGEKSSQAIVTDLMVWRGHDVLAVEVQKSNIDAEDFSKRCRKYAQAQIPVLWVFLDPVPTLNSIIYLKEWQKRCAGNNFGMVYYLLPGGRLQPIRVTPGNSKKTYYYGVFYRQEVSVADLRVEPRDQKFANPRHPSDVGVLPPA